jgi:hypothetical protein
MASNFKNYWLRNTTINSIKEYQLTVDNTKTAGQVFKELKSLGILNISIERIEHSQIQEFRTKVKIDAIKAAKEKAKSLTNAIDQRIEKAIYIQKLNNQVYRTHQGQVSGLSNREYSNKLQMEQKP